MAIEKTINIKVDTNEATQNVDQLTNSFEELNEETVYTFKEFKELKKQLKEMAIAGQTGTKEFKDLSAKLGQMQRSLNKANKDVKNLSQSFNKTLYGSLQGVASIFEITQGVMGAFGVESENVEKALLKVQSAMAISKGLEGLKKAIVSFKALAAVIRTSTVVQAAFNAVMNANPIAIIITAVAALVAGIVALIMNFKAITNWLGITNDEAENLHKENLRRTEEFIKQQGERIKAISKERDEIKKTRDFEIKMMKARGDSEEDIFKAIRKNRMERIVSNNEFQKQVAKQNEALSNQFDLLQESGDLTKEKADEINALIKKNNESMIKAQEESQDLLEQVRIDDVNKAREAELEKARLEKEARDKKEQAEKEAANKRKAREDKEAADRKAREEKELAERLARLAKLAEEESKFIEDKTSLEDKYLESKISKEQQEINAVYDKYFAIIEAAKQYGEDTVLLEEAQQAAVKEIQDRYQAEREAAAQAERDAKKAQDDADAKAELEREAALRNAKIEMAQQSLQAISDLVTAFAGESEEAQRRAFNINKAISIGQAIISTAQGIITQLAVPQDALTGANFVKAGIVAATGAAQIATISATQFQANGSGGGGGGTTPTAPNPPTAVSTPAVFNVVGNTGTNQLAETLGQQPLQAYVVAGDVTTAQSLERNKIQQSTL